MLDTETKRRIDTARDILVGKVPDPKSQVEQITIALIYKFMDDMDKESVELGGVPSFFSGEYAKYSWTKIFDPKVGGHEMLNLYGEAILKLNQNPSIPQLFRDIFKNAYLPYRDPETLKLFLKTINEFHYDHSEMLGDAFEYLLSVLGSQGDAGQFRTPRHIIDFIIQVLEPKKNETICDPACGTAGFLISSYKYILEQNTKKHKGDLLTPDDRKKLMKNFRGYDISPDMVRLSLVNMYLHGFTAPNIYEYDTLTSEDRWNEYFDIIMANPPFMSPKGGIKPHKKFTIPANRSELLFVDYIAEHIHPVTGRAGIIVPEGIIFQSANAYKALRKMLVDKKYLYAVVSLPAGIFQPYSGVKTSILFIDKTIAKKTDNILFVKIDNDGFDLGAQRRAIDKNDLTGALKIIQDYKKYLNHDLPDYSDFDDYLQKLNHDNPLIKKIIVQTVTKKKIGEKGDYNLSVDRYREVELVNRKNPMVRLDQIFLEIKNGKNVQQFNAKGKYRVTRIQTISDGTVNLEKTKWTNDEVKDEDFMREGDILLSHINSMEHLGKSAIFKNHSEKVVHGINLIRFRPNYEIVIPEFIAAVFKSEKFISLTKRYAQKAVNQASIKTTDLKEIQIPLPPLSIQQQIVSKIESYQAIINGAKQVVENYKPQIDIDPDWEMVELGEVIDKKNDSINPQDYKGFVSYVGLENIESNTGNLVGEVQASYQDIKSTKNKFLKGDVLYGKLRPNLNKVWLAEFDGIASTDIFILRAKHKISINKFYSAYLKSEGFNKEVLAGLKGAQLPRVGYEYFSLILIPLPSLFIQQQIVNQIEQEQQLVNANKELIKIYKQKIKDEIDKLWKKQVKEYVMSEDAIGMVAEE